MSDDFMNDISSAVENGGALPVDNTPIEKLSSEPKQVQPIKPNTKDTTSVADELSNMFANNDPHNPSQPVKKVEEKPETKNLPKELAEDTTKQAKPAEENDTSNKQRQQRKGQEKLLDTFLKEDAEGNLVNDAGEVIALAGKSRTYYEGLKNEARKQRKAAADLAVSNMQLAQQFKSLYDEYKGISESTTSPVQNIVKETGFSQSEATEAIKLMQQYKADPISAIKNLLTQAKMNGIDISKIGANISVDPAVIRNTVESLLDERLKPLSDRAQEETAQQVANREAQTFLQTYPEAQQFTDAIATAKRQFPHMSLPEIWLRLREKIEERAHTQQTTSVTKHRKAPASKTRPSTPQMPKVKAQVRDYSAMSFEDIKNSIIEDFGT